MEVSRGLAVVIVVNLVVDVLCIWLSIYKVFKMSIRSFCTALVIETYGQSDLQTTIKIYIFNLNKWEAKNSEVQINFTLSSHLSLNDDGTNSLKRYLFLDSCSNMLKNSFIFSFSFRESDVAGIDINMGCPKEYSTKASGFQLLLNEPFLSWRYGVWNTWFSNSSSKILIQRKIEFTFCNKQNTVESVMALIQ